jgi:nucleotide-binding universal stress UspA family protein
MLQRILIALDGSAESEQILSEAEKVAGPDAAFDFIHVLWTPPRGGLHPHGMHKDEADQYLQRIARRYPDRQVRTHLWSGNPESALPIAGAKLGAQLTAMTTHARSGLSHLLMGSVAEAVVRRASGPVLLTRPGLPQIKRRIERVLVAVDGTRESGEVCETVRQVVPNPDFEMIVLQVVVPIVIGDPVTGYVPIGVPRLLPDPAPALEAFARHLSDQGVHTRAVVAFGGATDQILENARKLDVDLIAMRTAGRGGAARFFMGSVTEKVIRHMDRPVLVDRAVPREGSEAFLHETKVGDSR